MIEPRCIEKASACVHVFTAKEQRVACYYQAYRGNDQPIVPLCLWPWFARDLASVINLTSAFLSIALFNGRNERAKEDGARA